MARRNQGSELTFAEDIGRLLAYRAGEERPPPGVDLATYTGVDDISVATTLQWAFPKPSTPFLIDRPQLQDWVFVLTLSDDGEVVAFEMLPKNDEWLRQQTGHEVEARQSAGVRGFPIRTEGPTLTRRMLRLVPLGELHQAARNHRRWTAMTKAAQAAKYRSAESLAEALDELTPVRPGRAGRPDLYYAQVAEQYVGLLGSGREVQQLAEARHQAATTISSNLHEARTRGLLTPSPKGRAGGRLTAKAIEILQQGDQ